MSKKTRLARVDEGFLKIIKESGMTSPSYTRKLAENIRLAKDEEVVQVKKRKRGFIL